MPEWIASVTIATEPVTAPATILSRISAELEAIERPAALLRYVEEHGQGLYPDQVRDLRHQWYAGDKGRHAVAEILDIMQK